MKKEINSTEIARLAGVSRSTVSRVVNGYKNVPQETHEKVMAVIDRYRYVPNHSAQVLKGKPTKTLGLFWISRGRIAEDFLAEYIIVTIIENAASQGYHILTCVVPDLLQAQNTRTVRELYQQKRIDGGIFIGLNSREPFIEELVEEGFVVGLFDYGVDGTKAENRVIINFDSETSARAVDYLVELGHHDIGLINGDILRYSGMQKYEGFAEGLRRNGLLLEPAWVGHNGFSEASGYDAMKTMLDRSVRLPTAICCANDSIAFGAIRALREAGHRVPEDVSVIGIDDHMRSATSDPPLTTFREDFDGMLSALAKEVIRVSQGEAAAVMAEFTGELVVRKSCIRLGG